MYTNILGYNVFNKSKKELLEEIDKRDKINIISGNPEVLFNGLNNEKLDKNFKEDYSLIIPDGVGTVIASKIVKNPVKEKIAGIEVVKEIFEKCQREGKGVYLLGTTEENLKKCKEKIGEEYKNLSIVGSHNGFFDLDNCEEILQDIKNSKPWGLFVAMGCPRQEIFIEKYIDELPCKFYMGVGGSLDVISGNVKRAPRWMINIGMEWAYRVFKEPWRIKRLGSIPKFLWLVIKNR